MKAFYIKDVNTFLPPYKDVLDRVVTTAKAHFVVFPNGCHGFILGNKVLAPFCYQESVVVQKDGHNIVLTFASVNRWGISIFLLPFDIVTEPIHFRREHIHSDSYLFRVYRHVTMCHPLNMSKGKGRLELNSPDQFCPVYDRHCHLIGLVIGSFKERLVCVDIHAILEDL